MNKPVSGSTYRNLGAIFEELRVSAQKDPNMTVAVNEGSFYVDGMNIVEFEGGNSPIIQAPTSGNKWLVIGLNKVGTIFVVSGTPVAKNTELPKIEKNQLPLAAIYLTANCKKITGDIVFDIRPFMASGTYPGDHSLLENTELANCHPISAITGLTEKLDGKVEYSDLSKVSDKIDNILGTNSATFVINQAQSGEPYANAGISVSRGSESNVGIRFNEKKQAWEFTNDGATWNDFVTAVSLNGTLNDATASNKGVVKLSVDPEEGCAAVAVGTNDPRLAKIEAKADASDVYKKAEVDTKLADKMDVTAVYNRQAVDEMLAGKINVSTIYTEAEIDAKLLGKVSVGTVYDKLDADILLQKKADADSVYVKADVDKALALKSDAASVYTKEDADKALALKADIANVYNKSEIH